MHSAGQSYEGGAHKSRKKKKLGHRRVKIDGEVTYKKIETTQLIGSIQLGVQHAVGSLANVALRDLLMKDFMSVGKKRPFFTFCTCITISSNDSLIMHCLFCFFRYGVLS